ncbi:hypothetical protein FFL01_21300 [Flavobacterium flevense]|uniref:Right handed beta helix domain-containing protein n=2 Tax=Flavobacterium flevense TaxID=983 RepID=A0A4Y4AWI1_9FLAO|nr:hypothetical protein FFL01_21300 [Flavobacterium flevense]
MKKMKFLALTFLLVFMSCSEELVNSVESQIAEPQSQSENEIKTSLSGKLINTPSLPNATSTISGTILTFTQTGKIGTADGSLWNPTLVIPANSPLTEIKINANVTLYGNIVIKKTNFIVTGDNRDNSIIDGSRTPYTKGDRSLCSIRHDGNGTISISKLQSRNPANFHLTGFSNATISEVKIIENRETHSTDGFHFAKGAIVDQAFIDTYDDVLYVGEVTKISNSTIYHNKNGAIFMVSWGQKVSDIGTGITEAINCTFIDNYVGTDNYAHGIVGWSQKKNEGAELAKVKFTNCIWKANPSKPVKRSPFYTFGRISGENPDAIIKDGTIEQIGGNCAWTNPSNIRYGIGVVPADSQIIKPSTCP